MGEAKPINHLGLGAAAVVPHHAPSYINQYTRVVILPGILYYDIYMYISIYGYGRGKEGKGDDD